jgi:hypothetical protein
MMICVDCLFQTPDEEEAADLVYDGLSLCYTHMYIRKARRDTTNMTGPEYRAMRDKAEGLPPPAIVDGLVFRGGNDD